MKVYLVIDRDDERADNIFGAFSCKEKAEEIMNNLLKNFSEFGDCEDHDVAIIELTLDEVTNDYHWYMSC